MWKTHKTLSYHSGSHSENAQNAFITGTQDNAIHAASTKRYSDLPPKEKPSSKLQFPDRTTLPLDLWHSTRSRLQRRLLLITMVGRPVSAFDSPAAELPLRRWRRIIVVVVCSCSGCVGGGGFVAKHAKGKIREGDAAEDED